MPLHYTFLLYPNSLDSLCVDICVWVDKPTRMINRLKSGSVQTHSVVAFLFIGTNNATKSTGTPNYVAQSSASSIRYYEKANLLATFVQEYNLWSHHSLCIVSTVSLLNPELISFIFTGSIEPQAASSISSSWRALISVDALLPSRRRGPLLFFLQPLK